MDERTPEQSQVSSLLLRHITPAAGGPLYQQIVDAVKREISQGRLAPGAPMPSFRVLARELMVSLITVKRAYEELAREGVLVLRQGLGTFVAPGGEDASRRAQLDQAAELAAQAAALARGAGLSPAQIQKMFHQIIQEQEGDES